MRESLLKQGYFENNVKDFENQSYKNHAFHLLYSTKSKDAFKF